MIHLCPDELVYAAPLLTWIGLWRTRVLDWLRLLPQVWCRHAERIRERREDGGLDSVCSRCGDRVVLVGRVAQPGDGRGVTWRVIGR